MIAYFARHPVASNLMLIAAIYLGFTALPLMERETFPEFSPSQVTVTIPYPGASAEDVDEELCIELEDALNAVDNLKEMECLSVAGSATATLEMVDGADIGQFYNDISSEVSAIQDLPDESEEAAISIAGQTEQIALVAVSGIDTADALVRYADRLADRLMRLPGVASADVAGISDSQLTIRLDETALRRFNVSPRDVADAVAARSLQTPLGTVETEGRDINLRYADARRAVREIESLIVLENADGGLVRVGDVADVLLEPADSDLRAAVDGAPAAIISLSKTKADDAIDAFAAVSDYLNAERARYPDPFAITVINNSTELIEERINLVLTNAGQSLALVIIVMFFFFGLREALWISLALPFSFLGALFVLNALGISINMISLLALLMAIGLIMDDSIVIAENIDKWRSKAPPLQAAIQGTREVMPGVVSSFLTTAGVFGPLMFLSGEIGTILQVIPIVLLITLAVSLIEAFLILPNHLSHVAGDPAREAQRWAPRFFEAMKERAVLPTVAVLTEWRYLTLGFTVALLIISVAMVTSGRVKVVGFPVVEADTIEARVALTPGLQRARTEATVAQLLRGLEAVDQELTPGTEGQQPLVEQVLVRFAANSDVKDNGAHTATVTVDLLSSDARNVTADQVLAQWRVATGPVPDLQQINFTSTSGGPGGEDLDVEVRGDDLEELVAASEAMLARLLARQDVTSAYQDFGSGRPEIQLVLSEFGYTQGLTPQDLANQLRTAFTGTDTDQFQIGVSRREVVVEMGATAATLLELETFPITLPSGEQVALSRVAALVPTGTYSQITRREGQAVARIQGKIDRAMITPAQISDIAVNEIGPDVQAAYPGVSFVIGGATEDQQETQTSILTALLSGLAVIYIVLAYQFHSYTLPFFIMVSIPFALIGVVWGHWLMGMDISMPSFVGFASLAGIVVNNAILFMSFFGDAARNGHHVDAAIDAVRRRFRPVLLSSLTTFIGLMPILFETSPSVATIVPVVVSVAFGLLASFLLVVFVFPSVIAIYFDFRNVDAWLDQAPGEPSRPPEPAGQT